MTEKNTAGKAYQKLKSRFADIKNIKNVMSILSKDQETAMAPGSEPDRIAQVNTLAALAHRLLNDPDLRKWLDEAEKEAHGFSKEDRRNLTLMRDRIEDGALPEILATEKARLETEGSALHTRMRASGDWNAIKDWYRHAFDIMRKIGHDRMSRRGFSSAYEALLDSFSPGMREDMVARELARVEQALPTLIKAALARQQKEPPPIPLTGTFPKEQQNELCRRIVTAMGFDFSRGRFDIIDGHPSSGGTSDDTRFTTAVNEADFLDAVYTTIHETGHALYDQNQPSAWRYQPAGGHLGMAMHESQSRIMEMQAAMTPEFFTWLSEQVREVFGRHHDPALSADNLHQLKMQVRPSFIRVHADELTYPAHIILRHRLEKALIEGKLGVDDLPQSWNKGMQELLGITPPDKSKGCMQDVHWPTGAIGYFPAYTLGDMGAAQLFSAACRDRPETRSELGKGNFVPLREWLRDNIHSKGALMTPDELFQNATGEPLNAQHYLDHIAQRYLGQPYAAILRPAVPNSPSQNLG